MIMISAVDETESVVRCIEIGADDYLPKPFNPVILRARINAGLTKKRLHDLERARVHDVFCRFLPEHVVDDVLERTDDDLRLGGVRSVGTVMFTDLRGFTAFSEDRPPELVIDALNRYFDETSDAILEHGGTLVAYRGDGFLAAFGAPIEVEDHADRALATARDMVDVRLPRFNEWLRSNGLGEDVRMGIGLNSGPFMSGNVGSLRRLEYTVHGDTVNTASRIEGLTKTLGGPILLSESTRAALLRPPTTSGPRGGRRAWTAVDRRPVGGRRRRRAAASCGYFRLSPDRASTARLRSSTRRPTRYWMSFHETSALPWTNFRKSHAAMTRQRIGPSAVTVAWRTCSPISPSSPK